jgi:hypothetical protein
MAAVGGGERGDEGDLLPTPAKPSQGACKESLRRGNALHFEAAASPTRRLEQFTRFTFRLISI